MEDRARLSFWIVAAIAAIVLLLRLGAPPLIDPDEARFARTTVEMVRTGDLVVPTFEGVPRIVKPPLLHWAQAAFFRVIGPGELSARLPSALATLGTLFLIGWVARRRFGEEGAAWAAAIYITIPLVVVIGRLGTIDALLAVHVFAALAIDMAEYGETGPNRGAVIGALLGLAFLAKGPVGVILPLLMILAGRTAAGRNVVPQRRAMIGFAAGFLVVVPWTAVFIRRLGAGRVLQTVRAEVLDRYFAGTDHAQPAWYFAAVVLVAFSPWVGPLAVALIRAVGLRRDPVARTGLYAAGAFLAALLFFSIGRGKLPHYVLPAAPLAALLVTWELGQALSAPKERRSGVLLLTGALFAEAIVLGAAAAVVPMDAARITASVAAAAYGIAALVAIWGVIGQRPRRVYGAAAAATVVLCLTGAWVLHPALGSYRSTEELIRAVPQLEGERPVVIVDIRLPSLTYYLDRVPEPILSEQIDARLDRDDTPIVVVASADLERIPRQTLARMREIGLAGKLHALVEIDAAGDAD